VLNSGVVTRLHDEVYARLHHGRLVLIGDPGAGKTGAMMLLLLEALRFRQQMPESARSGVPVPVWLTLGSWDPNAQNLRDWVTATLSRDHPYLRATDFGPNAAAQLFDTGRIALFMDGLDEMPDTLRSKAIEQLATETAGQRVVITSRPDEFRETIDLGRRRLPYTAVIELAPVRPRAAAEYLLEDQVGDAQQAWQAVAGHLQAHPEGVLAQTLNTPLTLSLTRAAYTADDPRRLLSAELGNEHQLRVHLLDQILIAAYPDRSKRAHATYWLGWLAHKMATQPHGPIRELRWWQIPRWIPRWQVALAGALVAGLSVSVGVFLAWLITFGLIGALRVGLIFGLVGALMVGLVSVRGFNAVTPRSMAVRLPKKTQDLRSVGSVALRVGFAIGLVLALVTALLGNLTFAVDGARAPRFVAALLGGIIAGLLFGIAGGLLVGVPLGLVELWRVPLAAMSAVTPCVVYRRDVRSHLVSGLMGGLIGGIVGALPGLLAGGEVWPLFGLLLGLSFGLTLGPVSGLVSGFRAGAAPSLLFTELALWRRTRRVRFMPLLDTALSRQVMRQAGAVYQFRHADLQDRLAERYEAGLVGATGEPNTRPS
jgi:hypothetical protein